MRRIRNAALVLCLFILYCVLLSQGLKANALSTIVARWRRFHLSAPLQSSRRLGVRGKATQATKDSPIGKGHRAVTDCECEEVTDRVSRRNGKRESGYGFDLRFGNPAFERNGRQ